MLNKFDIIILAVVFLFTAIGYYRGLIRSVLSLVQFFVVTMLSIYFAPIFSKILIEKFNLDLIIIDWAKNNIDLFANTIGIMSEEILKNIAGRIINVVSIIILFIVLKIIFTFIIAILSKIGDLPIINVVNKLGGLVFGIITGIIVVYLAIIIINWLPFASLEEIKIGLNQSILGSIISGMVPDVTSEVINLVKVSMS